MDKVLNAELDIHKRGKLFSSALDTIEIYVFVFGNLMILCRL